MATGERKPMPRMVDRICENPACAKLFQARQADVNRGQARYCCKSCAQAGARIPTMPLKSQAEVESWMRTTHTGAQWHEVLQYQRAEIDALRRLFPDGLRQLLEKLARGIAQEFQCGVVLCMCCGRAAPEHAADCIVLQARQLVGLEGDPWKP